MGILCKRREREYLGVSDMQLSNLLRPLLVYHKVGMRSSRCPFVHLHSHAKVRSFLCMCSIRSLSFVPQKAPISFWYIRRRALQLSPLRLSCMCTCIHVCRSIWRAGSSPKVDSPPTIVYTCIYGIDRCIWNISLSSFFFFENLVLPILYLHTKRKEYSSFCGRERVAARTGHAMQKNC